MQKTLASAVMRQGLFEVAVKQLAVGKEFVQGLRSGLPRKALSICTIPHG